MRELVWTCRVIEEGVSQVGKIPARGEITIRLMARDRDEAVKLAHDEAVRRGIGPIRSIDLATETDITGEQAVAKGTEEAMAAQKRLEGIIGGKA